MIQQYIPIHNRRDATKMSDRREETEFSDTQAFFQHPMYNTRILTHYKTVY